MQTKQVQIIRPTCKSIKAEQATHQIHVTSDTILKFPVLPTVYVINNLEHASICKYG